MLALRRSLLLLSLAVLGQVACAAPTEEAEEQGDDTGEPAEGESAIVPITEQDETAPASALAPLPLDAAEADGLLDIRGVGDSGWSNTHEKTPIAAAFGAALDRFDPSGKAVKGDLSFINWETVVGNGCTQFGNAYSPGRSYAFVSRPESLVQAYTKGFNLVGLSNNHARDCYASADTSLTGEVASADMTAKNVAALGEKDWITAGIASPSDERDFTKARVHTFTIKGRQVRVALASMYTGRPSCPRTTCVGDKSAILASLRDAQADVRILALHSMGATDQDEAVRIGVDFVKSYNGDIVFGHGPHVWKPLRVVRKSGGGTGVVFESLGNFLHPALGAQSKNFIGRALLDLRTLKLRQVQVLPVANSGRDIRWSSADGASLPSNLRWTDAPAVHGVYANVKP
ncbi:MAG: CapA family protein [Deltaproteobacteria bacterium]|nr:CapA family protein [Deltaproteobacteria bacterium]